MARKVNCFHRTQPGPKAPSDGSSPYGQRHGNRPRRVASEVGTLPAVAQLGRLALLLPILPAQKSLRLTPRGKLRLSHSQFRVPLTD